MYRKIIDVITEGVREGFEQGIDRFVEALEADIVKESVFENHDIKSIMIAVMENSGVEIDTDDMIDEDINEEKLDQLIKTVENELNS